MENITITNREEVIDQLTELLMQFAKAGNSYQTDVYMYLDSEGKATLDTFINVGGNSWLNDDHYTIYSDKEHFEAYDGYFDFDNISDFAEVLGVSKEQLTRDVRNAHGYDDDDEEVTEQEVYDYLMSRECPDEYADKLAAAFAEWVDECRSDYYEQAEEILAAWEDAWEEE